MKQGTFSVLLLSLAKLSSCLLHVFLSSHSLTLSLSLTFASMIFLSVVLQKISEFSAVTKSIIHRRSDVILFIFYAKHRRKHFFSFILPFSFLIPLLHSISNTLPHTKQLIFIILIYFLYFLFWWWQQKKTKKARKA